jgi:hypothetical protein
MKPLIAISAKQCFHFLIESITVDGVGKSFVILVRFKDCRSLDIPIFIAEFAMNVIRI